MLNSLEKDFRTFFFFLQKMEAKDLIKLHFHKNNEGKRERDETQNETSNNVFFMVFFVGDFHCPITFRVFNENSHIVAIRTSGNVYSYEVCR